MSAFQTDVVIEGANQIFSLWQQAPALVEEELTNAVLEGSLLMEREVRQRTPEGVGGESGLKGSIAAQAPRVLADEVIGEVGTPLNYAIPVELGSKPHFPPVEPLADWAQFKLGVPAAEARSVGYLIARKISRVGTEGAFMFSDAFNQNEGELHQIFSRAHARIIERLAGE